MFDFNINFLDDAKWDEHKHPRGESGSHGGQFVSKGQEGAGSYPKNTYKQHVKPMGLLEGVVKNYGDDTHHASNEIKSIVAGYSHPTIAAYGNNLLRWLEQKHGLNHGELGKVKSKEIPLEKKKHFKATLAKLVQSKPAPAAPTPTASKKVYAPGTFGAEPTAPSRKSAIKHPAIQQIDDIVNNMSNPIVAAQKIKNLSMAGGGYNSPEVQAHVKEAFEGLLKYNKGYTMGINEVISGQTKVPTGEPEPTQTPKPTSELPMYHPTAPHQKNLYEIASDPNNITAGKIALITNYPTVVNYPEGFTAKYANELIKALGGEPIKPAVATPTPQPTTSYTPPPDKPTLKPAPSDKVIKPSNPSKSWQVAQQRFAKAFNPTKKESWSQAEAENCFVSAKNSNWNSLQKKSGGKLNNAVISYGGSGYDGINGALRDETDDPLWIQKAVTIDDAFSEPESLTLQDTIVMRGTNFSSEFVNKLKNGLKNNKPTRFPLDGFSSCSFSKVPAFANKPYWLEIVTTKGTPLLCATNALGSHEREVLLRHGQAYEVMEIEENYQTPGGYGKRTRIRCITV